MHPRRILWLVALAAAMASTPMAVAASSGADETAAEDVVVLSAAARRELRAAAAPQAARQGVVTQSVSVVVAPGPLTIITAPTTVELRRVDAGVHEGTVRGVRVVDARGTYAGWTLDIHLSNHSQHRDALVTTRVQKVVATADTTSGIVAEPRPDRRRGRSTVVRAEPGFGAGAFDVTFTVRVFAGGEAQNLRTALEFELS